MKSRRPVNCYVNVKHSRIKAVLFFGLSFDLLYLGPVVVAVVTVENSQRFWRRVFHSFHSLDLLFNLKRD